MLKTIVTNTPLLILNRITISFFLITAFRITGTFGQVATNDSLFVQKSLQNSVEQYNRTFKEESHLYNGTEYTELSKKIKGTPYFEAIDWTNGSVFYEGTLYNNVPMLYDIVNDVLVLKDFNGVVKIKLVSEQIQYFSLSNHYFVRIESKGANDSTLTAGFYDFPVDGKVKVFIKKYKTIFEVTNANTVEKEYIDRSNIFILKDKKYYSVSSKSSILKLLKDRKKEVSKYLRDNKIRFGSNKENAIIKMVEHYNSLQN